MSSKKINFSDGEYTIIKLQKEDLTDSKLSISFDSENNKISGNTGCNNYFGSYIKTDNSLTFSKIGQTKKYCADKEVNRKEKLLISTLSQVQKINKSNEIILIGANEEVLMILQLFK